MSSFVLFPIYSLIFKIKPLYNLPCATAYTLFWLVSTDPVVSANRYVALKELRFVEWNFIYDAWKKLNLRPSTVSCLSRNIVLGTLENLQTASSTVFLTVLYQWRLNTVRSGISRVTGKLFLERDDAFSKLWAPKTKFQIYRHSVGVEKEKL